MSLLSVCTIFLGSMAGIAKYKQQPVDYKLVGTYFGIITPYQCFTLYSNLDVLNRIRIQHTNPFVHIPMTLAMITIANGGMFGVGYVVGKTAYSALSIARHS